MTDEDRPGARAARDRMMAGHGDFSHEHRIVRPDGSLLWVVARGRLIRDEQGRPARFIGVSVDITERRLAEARQAFLLRLQDSLRGLNEPREILTAAAAHLGRYLGAARIGFSEMQPDGETLLITNGFADGLAPVNGVFPLAAFGPYHAAAMREGRTLAYEDALADERGTKYFGRDPAFGLDLGTRAHVSVPLMRDGRYCGSLYVTHDHAYQWPPEEIALIEDVAARIWDAAERGRAETRLRESEQRMRLLLDSTGLGPWEYDVATGTTIRSARHDEIFGYAEPVSDWERERIAKHIPEPDRARVVSGLRAALDPGQDWDVETRIVRADGSPGWVRIRARPHRGADGKVCRLLGTVADITEARRTEEAAKETAAKFEMFAQSMPSMVWTSRPDGAIDWFNNRVPEYCGIPPGQLKPNGWAPGTPR